MRVKAAGVTGREGRGGREEVGIIDDLAYKKSTSI